MEDPSIYRNSPQRQHYRKPNIGYAPFNDLLSPKISQNPNRSGNPGSASLQLLHMNKFFRLVAKITSLFGSVALFNVAGHGLQLPHSHTTLDQLENFSNCIYHTKDGYWPARFNNY